MSTPAESTAEQSPLELVVFVRDEAVTYPLPAHGEVTIGRAEGSDVRIEHPSVSRRHASLRLGGGIRITDLGGANGTFVRDHSEPDSLASTRTMRRLARADAELAVGESVLLGEVTALVRRAAEVPSKFEDLGSQRGPTPGVIIQNPAMRLVYAHAELAARSPISVLILGETGVGKDLLARAIHARSPRANGPLMSINCAALSESLLEGEIFGYERGAFTGAVQARPGLFEAANGGSVFLDEIGELTPATQAKLLRVLEDRSVLRLGARAARPIDVRFLAATNRDLEAESEAGRFRADLYFRVAGLCLTIAPLRERREEIEPLFRAFLATAARQLDRPSTVDVVPSVLEILLSHDWPGNVRELKNVAERAVVLCSENTVLPEHLPRKLVEGVRRLPAEPEAKAEAVGRIQPPAPGELQAKLKAFERERLVEALASCAGNQTRAAELLGISRRTLVSRLSEFGITRPRRRPSQ